MKILLDSSAILDIFDGTERGVKARRLIRESTLVCTTCLNIYEVKYRLFKKAPHKAVQAAQEIISSVKVLPITLDASLAAIEVKKMRPSLSTVDCNAYTTALQNNLFFVTGDRDFAGLKNAVIL